MDSVFRLVRLASHPREDGLWCEPEGLILAGHPLLEKTESGFVPIALSEVQRIFDQTYRETERHSASSYLPGMASIARFLNQGDLPLAMIGSVLLTLPEIPDAPHVAGIDPKRAYDDTEARSSNQEGDIR